MKVAQLTLDVYDNWGNILQKYALHRVLKNFSNFTEVLWLKDNNFFHDMGAWLSHNPKKSLYSNNDYQRNYFYEAVKAFKFKEFENRYIKTRFDIPYIEDIADDYDFFVVGSDQVWNPAFVFGEFPGMFLDSIPRNKKISYAASISVPKISQNLIEAFRQGISSFNNISVREENAVKIVKELTGRDALLVLDPTLLLTPEQWLEIAQKPSWLNEKYQRGYILTYYYWNHYGSIIESVAKKLNLPVINLFDLDNYWHYIVGPEEFIYLVANATLTFILSFHCTILSILFKRPFINFEADLVISKSTRIPEILKMFGLENRIMLTNKKYKIESLLEIDYSTRDKILLQERNKSLQFLLNALGGGKL